MSEIENGRLGFYATEHLKFNHPMTLGFKGLSWVELIGSGDVITLKTHLDSTRQKSRQSDFSSWYSEHLQNLTTDKKLAIFVQLSWVGLSRVWRCDRDLSKSWYCRFQLCWPSDLEHFAYNPPHTVYHKILSSVV